VYDLSVYRVFTGLGIGGMLAAINAVAAEFSNDRRRSLNVSLMAIGYPIGAVIGALTLALAASPLLTFMHIPPDWQVAANGAILIVVLAARVLISRKDAER